MERDTRITRIKDALWADRPRIEADFGFVRMTRPDHERGVLYVVVSPFPNADPAIYEASMSNARIDAELQITGPIDPPLGFDTEDQTAWRLQYLESLQYGLIDDLERMVKIARRQRLLRR